MAPEYQVSAGIDERAAIAHLRIGGTGTQFLAPVHGNDDNVAAPLFLADARRHIVDAVIPLGKGEEANAHAILFPVPCVLVACYAHAGIHDVFSSVVEPSLLEVQGVVVGHRTDFDAGAGEYLHEFRATTEIELPVGALGRLRGQGAFEVDDGKVILRKDVAHIGEKVIQPILFRILGKASPTAGANIAAQRTVAHGGDEYGGFHELIFCLKDRYIDGHLRCFPRGHIRTGKGRCRSLRRRHQGCCRGWGCSGRRGWYGGRGGRLLCSRRHRRFCGLHRGLRGHRRHFR